MAATPSPLTSGANATDLSSYATASITPGANRIVLPAILNYKADFTTPPTPTLSGNSLTYVQVATVLSPLNVRLTLFRAIGSAPSAGAITIDCGGVTQGGCEWHVTEFIDGVAVIQGVSDSGLLESPFVVTLAAFSSIRNIPFGAFINESGGDITPGSNFGQIYDTQVVLPLFSEYGVANTTVVDATRGAGGANWAGIAVEICEATASRKTILSQAVMRSAVH